MPDCRNLEPMLAPYVDGEAEPQTRAAIDRHLEHCPPCRQRVASQRAARELLLTRREGLRVCATEHLRQRCAAQRGAAGASAAAQSPPGILRRTILPLSLAASLLVVAGLVFFLTLSSNVEVLAAQLAVDHLKCHQFPPEHATPPDPNVLAEQWLRDRGWPIRVPAARGDQELELLGVRLCGSTEGPNAHIMYKWHGHPLSVYVMNSVSRRATDTRQFVSTVGQDAIIWTDAGRTYAVVGRGRPQDLERIVDYVKVNVRSW